MLTIKRYMFYRPNSQAKMIEQEDGDYVKYDDIKHLIDRKIIYIDIDTTEGKEVMDKLVNRWKEKCKNQPPNTNPPGPPEPPKPPLCRIRNEDMHHFLGSATYCKKCDSTMKWKGWLWNQKEIGCIQPECDNYWKDK